MLDVRSPQAKRAPVRSETPRVEDTAVMENAARSKMVRELSQKWINAGVWLNKLAESVACNADIMNGLATRVDSRALACRSYLTKWHP